MAVAVIVVVVVVVFAPTFVPATCRRVLRDRSANANRMLVSAEEGLTRE